MTDVTEERLSVRDLVQRTGVPVTTIHHYVRTGVMPAPARECVNRFTYDERHVQALQLIRVLRQRQIPLSVIGQVLPELLAADDALRAEIWARILAAPTRPPSPAADAAMERVLEAATREFARHGYADASVASISEAAGLAKGSLYRLFPSKESLFLATAEAVVARATAAFAAAASQAGGRIREDQATTTLHRLLKPDLPVLLELAARGMQGQPEHRRLSHKLLGSLAADVSRAVGASLGLGRRIVGAAVGRGVISNA
jgi:AcrR family transcriptional regulator